MEKKLALAALLFLAAACTDDNRGDNGGTDGGTNAGPAVKVSGRVLDRSGQKPVPVPGATVEVVGASPAISATTGADGAFSLMVPSRATAFVRASATGFMAAQRGLVVPETGANLDLVVIASTDIALVGALLGLSLDSAKGIVALGFSGTNRVGGFGATLSAAHAPSFAFSAGGLPTTSTTTIANGDEQLIFPNTTAGTTTVTPTAPTGGSCTSVEAITDWRVDAGVLTIVELDCQAPPGAPVAVKGRVSSGSGALAGATVEVVGATPANSTTTDAAGAWSLQVPANTKVFVRATATGHLPLQTGLLVPPNGASDVDFEPPASAEVSAVAALLGLALDTAKGIVVVRFDTPGRPGGYGATLSAPHGPPFTFLANGNPGATSVTVAGGDPALVFPNATAGTTTVDAVPPAGASCEPLVPIRDWRVDAGVVTVAGFRCAGTATATLSGKVVSDAGTGNLPIAGATVEIAGASPPNTTTTNASGEYSLAVTGGDVVFVRASAAGYFPRQVGLKVPAQGLNADLRLVPTADVAQVATALGAALDPAKGIFLVRFDGVDGVAGFGATLGAAHGGSFVFDAADAPTPSAATLAGGDNTVVFPNTTAGTTTVAVSTPAGYACTQADAEKGITAWRVDGGVMTEATWRCASTGAGVAVTGRVTHESSNVAGATVEAVGASISTTTAGDGTYTLTLPSAGTFFVRASASGYMSVQHGLVVPAGGATLDINLISTASVAAVATAVGLTVDATKGIVMIQFEGAATTGGYGATLSAAHGSVFAFGPGGPVLSTTSVAGGKAEIAFPNTVTGTTTVTAAPPSGHACTPDQAITDWRVDAGVMTRFRFNCN